MSGFTVAKLLLDEVNHTEDDILTRTDKLLDKGSLQIITHMILQTEPFSNQETNNWKEVLHH